MPGAHTCEAERGARKAAEERDVPAAHAPQHEPAKRNLKNKKKENGENVFLKGRSACFRCYKPIAVGRATIVLGNSCGLL